MVAHHRNQAEQRGGGRRDGIAIDRDSDVSPAYETTRHATLVASGSVEATTNSAQAIRTITDTIGKVDETSTAIASAVEQQGAVTQEISRDVIRAAEGTWEVAASIAVISDATQQTGVAAEQVQASAGELARNGEVLRAQVSAFLSEVRTA